MKKVCIVAPENLTMPAIKGGAIETLLQNVIDENEKMPRANLTILAAYDVEADAVSKKRGYRYTEFVYLKKTNSQRIANFIYRVARKFSNKVFRTDLPPRSIYADFINNYVQGHDFDRFVNEAGPYNELLPASKKVGKENCFAHLHNNFKSTELIEMTFGKYLSCSNFTKQYWLNHSKVSPEMVKVLPNCADIKLFSKKISQEEKKYLRKNLGFTEDDFVLIFCGRINPEKGVLELISAVNLIDDEHVKLMVIGSPNFGGNSKRTEYERKVDAAVKRARGRVAFTGYVDHAELYKYHNIADCAVVPSVWEEPAGLVVIEALMSGDPLIVTRAGGATEYVNDKSAVIVDRGAEIEENLKEAILKIKENPELRKQMSKEALKQGDKFTTRQYFEGYMDILGC